MLCNFYGSTEVMGDVTYFMCDNHFITNQITNVPIGKPIFNTEIYVLNENLKPVSMGEIGEIYVSGCNVVDGYVNKRDEDRFVPNQLNSDPSK